MNAEFRRFRRDRGRKRGKRVRNAIARARGIAGRVARSDEVRIIGGTALTTAAHAGIIGAVTGGGLGALGGGLMGAAKAPRVNLSIGEGFRRGAMAGGMGGAAGLGMRTAKRGLVIGAIGGTGFYALKKLHDLRERRQMRQTGRRRRR